MRMDPQVTGFSNHELIYLPFENSYVSSLSKEHVGRILPRWSFSL